MVDRLKDPSTIVHRLIWKNKYDRNGTLRRRKARVEAKGYSQRAGIRFQETFARLSSITVLVTLTVEYEMEINQLDITITFLNGDVEEKICTEIPVRFKERLETRVAENRKQKQKFKKVDEAEKRLQEKQKKDHFCQTKDTIDGLK